MIVFILGKRAKDEGQYLLACMAYAYMFVLARVLSIHPYEIALQGWDFLGGHFRLLLLSWQL